MADRSDRSPRIAVAGGGIAGLEAVLAIRDWMGDAVSIRLISPHQGFVYRPLAVAEPFALTPQFEIDLNGFSRDTAATFHHGAIASVDPRAKSVAIDGEKLDFDHLIVATGARELPGPRDA